MYGRAAVAVASGRLRRGRKTDTEQDAAAQTVTVRLSEVTHSVFYAPQYVAMSQGFFADEGLDIDLSNGGGATRS